MMVSMLVPFRLANLRAMPSDVAGWVGLVMMMSALFARVIWVPAVVVAHAFGNILRMARAGVALPIASDRMAPSCMLVALLVTP